MKTLKISFVSMPIFKETIFFNLISKLSKKKIEFVSPNDCDLLFIGPYNEINYKKKIYSVLKKKYNLLKKIDYYFNNFVIKNLKKRIYKPLEIFYCTEYLPYNLISADYYISTSIGVCNENHLRIPNWKEHVDWSHEDVVRENDIGNAVRFGLFPKIEDLLNPLGEEFLSRPKKMCLVTSHMSEPRGSIYKHLSKYFDVDGYGPYFNKAIKDHNKSLFFKKDILKNYAFNLCPENLLYSGGYSEKIPDAFSAKCLPISWSDHNINLDFNKNAFVNLLDHVKDNYYEISNLLKDENYLKKFTKEPLFLKTPNLDKEKIFAERILNSL
jgi:hypothetical protein